MLSILPLAHVYELTLGLSSPYYVRFFSLLKKETTYSCCFASSVRLSQTNSHVNCSFIIEKMYKTRIIPEIKNAFWSSYRCISNDPQTYPQNCRQ